jgi:serine-type D-Ala-D-Ala carboxypeptidase (penicillin-binding protein 5/6)
MKARAQESERLIEWAYREFAGYTLVKAGDTVENADVWLGTEPKVPLTVATDAQITLPRKSRKDMKVTLVYDKPLKAPVMKGETVGKLVVTAPDVAPIEVPVITAASVERMGPLGRMGAAASYLVFGQK